MRILEIQRPQRFWNPIHILPLHVAHAWTKNEFACSSHASNPRSVWTNYMQMSAPACWTSVIKNTNSHAGCTPWIRCPPGQIHMQQLAIKKQTNSHNMQWIHRPAVGLAFVPGCVPTYTKAKTKWLSRNFALVGGATLHGHGWDRSLPPRRVPSLKETRFCGRRGDPFQQVPIHDQIVPHAAVRCHPMNSSAIALCQPSMRVQLHQLPCVIDLHHQLAFCQCIPIPHHLQCAAIIVVRIENHAFCRS